MTASLRLPAAAGVNAVGIRRAAVIGAGSMGSGIAAQFANAGIPVDLLDIAGPDTSRNAPALAGIERQMKSGGFMHPDAAGLVRPGNIDDHLDRLAEADWIVEAIVEKLDVKRVLYRKVDAVRRKGTIVSSNTSTIPRSDLVDGMGEAFAADFLITHFFNPPRVMRLVEIVSAPENTPAVVELARSASETVLGKTVVDCRDTPGFIANRIGCYWLAVAALEAKRLGLTVEEADAVNAAFGVPRTGAFGLLDLIGIDLVPQVWGSLMSTLPQSDAIHLADLPGDATIRSMIEAGRFGRKAKAGFYSVAADRSRRVMDLVTGEYRAEAPVPAGTLPGRGKDLAALLDSDERLGDYAWAVFSSVLAYAAEHAPEIAADTASVDTAIVLGYAWKEGPFRLADRYGAAKAAERFEREGRPVPALLRAAAASGGFTDRDGMPLAGDGKRLAAAATVAPGLAPAKAGRQRMFGNEAASVWDLGDGVACLEMHTKMNSFAPGVFDTLEETLARGGKQFRALVIGNDDSRAFSVGADLAFIVDMVRKEDWQALESYIARGQSAFLGLKYAPFPVVAAAQGFALGGGCEFMLHAQSVVAHSELNAGLPEVKVGLIPAWGGCTQLLARAQDARRGAKGPAAVAAGVFEAIFAAGLSSSALDARARHLLRAEDAVAMHRDHLIGLAKSKAVALCETAPAAAERALITVAGPSGMMGIMTTVRGESAAGRITANDAAIAEVLASVLTGGGSGDPLRPMTEEALMTLEREALLHLVRQPATRERIEHMLATGKPLRN